MDSVTGKNTKKIKILILSAPIGSGHQMAANALAEALSCITGAEVVQGNVFSFFPSVIGKFFLYCYAKILKICPGMYAMSYRWGNQDSGSLWMRNRINGALLWLGRSFIKSVRPDIVFSTHATPTGIISLYKEKYDPCLWLGVVVTDYTVHRWLVYSGVNAYFLADRKLFSQIHQQNETKNTTDMKNGDSLSVELDRDLFRSGKNEKHCTPAMYAYGIPIRNSFSKQNDILTIRKKLRDGLGWPENAFVCLLAGGGGGMLPMEEIIRSLRGMSLDDLYLMAVAGNNEGLRKKLETQIADGDPRLKVFGFTDEMPRLMLASDMIITKAGGVSLAECLACGGDTVIYSPLPGQEQANTRFVQTAYGVKRAENITELAAVLQQALAVPAAKRVQSQEQRRRAFGRPEAAKELAEFTKSLINIM